ncbi:MAG TPA: SLC13 family permease, partial [Candidatus Methylomirabilis sp.]|jgi:Na+/H+ antiporter NhaD/arsenite permease-like protein
MAEARGSAVEVELIRRRDPLLSAGPFAATIAGLILHMRIETAPGLGKGAMLVGVALLAAGPCLFLEGDRARDLMERREDWWTLAFFLLLFASAGTLRHVGVTGQITEGMVGLTGGSPAALFVTVTWASGILSAFMDNVLAVATTIPTVHDLAQAGAAVAPLWWGRLFGGTFLGNLTLIGSTANIVAPGILERQERARITFLHGSGRDSSWRSPPCWWPRCSSGCRWAGWGRGAAVGAPLAWHGAGASDIVPARRVTWRWCCPSGS